MSVREGVGKRKNCLALEVLTAVSLLRESRSNDSFGKLQFTACSRSRPQRLAGRTVALRIHAVDSTLRHNLERFPVQVISPSRAVIEYCHILDAR